MLVTRPQPGLDVTMARLAAQGFCPVAAPMLTIESRPLAVSHMPQAVLVTSANALASLPHALHAVRLFAVGDATAERAAAAGFGDVASAGRDGQALAALVSQRLSPSAGSLLLASGAGQGLALAADLRGRGFTVHRRLAYGARRVTALPSVAEAALAGNKIASALFFSAATAQAFLLCMATRSELVSGVEALAISHPTAQVLAGLPWRSIRVASHPNQDELVALLS